jgi:hypothetical protein
MLIFLIIDMLKHETPGQTALGFNYTEVTGESVSTYTILQILNV